ncbi:MAG TPA: helix-turn-helix domain-containing protein [Solirubrobacteraceae bacterium]
MSEIFCGSSRTVGVLDVDPDLMLGLDPEHEQVARARTRAPLIEARGPSWDPTVISEAAEPGWLGLFLVEGLMIRCVSIGSRTACELFGPGDLIRPWDVDGEYEPLPIATSWRVPRASKLAVLDDSFALRIAPWPTIVSRIVGRVANRARSLALNQAVSHLARADSRLLIVFWLLADRWGKVVPEGIRITLPLTHEVLAILIGVRRPTATLAVQRLTRAGLIARRRPDQWLLTRLAVDKLNEPESLELIDGRLELDSD